jgi:hypothetical protein
MTANISVRWEIIGDNYGRETTLVMVHPKDVAAVAGNELEGFFTGKSHLYIASEVGKIGNFVKVLGAAIGKPELPWIQFNDEETLNGMMAANFFWRARIYFFNDKPMSW